MKILLTTDWYIPAVNGVVTSVLALRRALQRHGHEVRILTLAGGLHGWAADRRLGCRLGQCGIDLPGARGCARRMPTPLCMR